MLRPQMPNLELLWALKHQEWRRPIHVMTFVCLALWTWWVSLVTFTNILLFQAFRKLSEHFIHIYGFFSTCFEKRTPQLVGHCLPHEVRRKAYYLAFICAYSAFRCLISLVSNQQKLRKLISHVLFNLPQPHLDVVEWNRVGYVINHQNTIGTSVVAASDCLETLLTSGIPLRGLEGKANVKLRAPTTILVKGNTKCVVLMLRENSSNKLCQGWMRTICNFITFPSTSSVLIFFGSEKGVWTKRTKSTPMVLMKLSVKELSCQCQSQQKGTYSVPKQQARLAYPRITYLIC